MVSVLTNIEIDQQSTLVFFQRRPLFDLFLVRGIALAHVYLQNMRYEEEGKMFVDFSLFVFTLYAKLMENS